MEQSGREGNQTRSLRARLMLMQGDLEGAGNWVDTFSGQPPDQPLLWLEEPQVTRVRILLARGTGADLGLAMQILEILDEIAERTHNTRYKIEILALRALALDAQGETSQADASLKQALDLARLGGHHPCFRRSGQTHADDAASACEAGSFRGERFSAFWRHFQRMIKIQLIREVRATTLHHAVFQFWLNR